MIVYSPIYKNKICKLKYNLNNNELKQCYKHGIGLGLDLVKSIEGESIFIFECPITNFKFFFPPSLAGDSEFYKKLDIRNSSYYNSKSWEFFLTRDLIKTKTSRILEIGCGNLSFLKLLKGEYKNLVGIELNDNAVLNGKKEGIIVFNELIEEFKNKNKEKFEVVCAFQVLEHIQNIDSFIESSLACLKTKGKFFIAVPNNRTIYFKNKKLLKHYTNDENYKLHCTTLALNSPPHHMGLWDSRSLKKLASKYSMRVDSINYEPLRKFRHGLIKDIIISKIRNIVGLKVAKYLVNLIFKRKVLEMIYKGDSILIVFEKL